MELEVRDYGILPSYLFVRGGRKSGRGVCLAVMSLVYSWRGGGRLGPYLTW